MGPFSFPKNLSAKLPTFKKARPEPTPEQFEAAKQSLLSLSEALKGEHGTRIRMQKQGDAVQFQATDESWGKHVRKHSPSSSFKDVRKTNKQIRAIAHVLKFHPDENVKSAAGLLLDCHGKHRALPKNTNTLRSAVWDVKQALQPAEKPDYTHGIPDAELKRLFNTEKGNDPSQSEHESEFEQPEQSEPFVMQRPGAETFKSSNQGMKIEPGNYIVGKTTAGDVAKNAALKAPFERGAAIAMLEILIYLQKENPNDLLLVTGDRVASHAGPIQEHYEVGYRKLALQIQALGMVYAKYPESRPDADEVRAAAKVLEEMSERMLDPTQGVQGMRNSPELIQALEVIVTKCAKVDQQPDIKAFYNSQADEFASRQRRISLQQLQGDALRERSTVGEGAGEWKADRAGATELYKYLYCDKIRALPDASLNLVRKPSGETDMRPRNTFILPPTFEDGEDVATNVGVDLQAGRSAAELVDRLGQQFATHSNNDIAAAGRDLMDIAGAVLRTDGTAQPSIRNSERLMNALATIALQGAPQAAK